MNKLRTSLLLLVLLVISISNSCKKNPSTNPPKANFIISPDFGTTITQFTFDASSCNDKEDGNENLMVSWDFDGDGNWDTDFDTSKTSVHHFDLSGDFSARLLVADSDGNKDSTKVLLKVGDPEIGSFTDPRDIQKYKIVKIGEQTWFAQNLNYASGNGTFCYQDQGINCSQYGKLYFYAVAKSACPEGWHLPDEDEWKQMEMVLGMTKEEADIVGWCGTDQGKQMKAIAGWSLNGNGTNSSGFDAFPGGFRFFDGPSFEELGYQGYWWTSTDVGDEMIMARQISNKSEQVRHLPIYQYDALSVRCVKNAD